MTYERLLRKNTLIMLIGALSSNGQLLQKLHLPWSH